MTAPTPTQHRRRRRHLLKDLRKQLPQSTLSSQEKILSAAVCVLALWDFSGLVMPHTAPAPVR